MSLPIANAESPFANFLPVKSAIGNWQSSKLSCVPLDEWCAEEKRGNCAETEKHSKRQQHLHVSLPLPRHQQDADDRTTQNTDEDRQNRESPTEISSDHEHHLHIAETHRLDAAKFLPRPTHQPERATADQRADQRAGKGR